MPVFSASFAVSFSAMPDVRRFPKETAACPHPQELRKLF
jgi:hypothetical protein